MTATHLQLAGLLARIGVIHVAGVCAASTGPALGDGGEGGKAAQPPARRCSALRWHASFSIWAKVRCGSSPVCRPCGPSPASGRAEPVKLPLHQLLLQLCSCALQHGLRLRLASGQDDGLARGQPVMWCGTAAPELLSAWHQHQRAGKMDMREQGCTTACNRGVRGRWDNMTEGLTCEQSLVVHYLQRQLPWQQRAARAWSSAGAATGCRSKQ